MISSAIGAASAAIKIVLDKSEAEKQAREFGQTIKSELLGSFGGANAAQAAVEALNGAVSALGRFLLDGAKGAAEYADAVDRLSAAMRLHGNSAEFVSAKSEKLLDSIQSRIAVSRTELVQMQATLAQYGANDDALDLLTRATLGYAEVTGKDLAASAREVGKIFDGQEKALKQIAMAGENANDVLRRLASEEKHVADAGTHNAIERLAKAWEDFGGAVGTSVDGLGVFERVADTLSAKLRELSSDLRDHNKSLLAMYGELALGIYKYSSPAGFINSLVNERLFGADKAPLDYGTGGMSAADPGARWSREEAEADFRARMRAARARLAGQDRDAREAAGASARIASERSSRWSSLGQQLADDVLGFAARETGAEGFQGAHGSGRDFGAEHKLEQAQQLADAQLEIQRTLAEETERINAESSHRQLETDRNMLDTKQAVFKSGLDAIGQYFGALVVGAIEGKSAEEITGQFFGGILQQVGSTLISLGSAGLAAAALGTAIPLFAVLTGGPAGVAASLAAITVGVGLTAGGAALSHATAPAKGGQAAPTGYAAPRSRPFADDFSTFDPFARGSRAQTVVYNVTFTGPVGGSARRIARDLEDVLTSGASLRGAS